MASLDNSISPPPPSDDPDDNIIRELVALQPVPVMAKLQVLLRSICTRITIQSAKIEKAEEQGRNAAMLKEEFEQFSKKALDGLKAEKEAEQNNWSKLIEEKLKGLDDVAKQYGGVVAALQGVDPSSLQKLTTQLAAIEENAPGLLEGKFLSDITGSGEHGPVLPINERMESLQTNFNDQNERISRLEDQIKDLKKTIQDNAKANASDIEALQKICRNLRSDIEMLPILGVTGPSSRLSVQEPPPDSPDFKVALSDVHSRLQRKADNDVVDQLVRSTAIAKEGLEKMKCLYEELKRQVSSMVPSPSRDASSSGIQDEVTAHLETRSEPQTDSHIVLGETPLKSLDEEYIDTHIKYLEEEIRKMASQLIAKADRKDFDGIQIRVALLEEGHHDKSSPPGTLSPDAMPSSQDAPDIIEIQEAKLPMQTLERQEVELKEQTPDALSTGEFANLKSSYTRLQLTLQKLQDLIATKADRNELLQLHDDINQQKLEIRRSPSISGGSFDSEKFKKKYQTLMLTIDNINSKIEKLEERSDLNVLISKRLENFAQPAATVQETTQGLDEMKDAINEHANRMMEYADTLLQMEALLASKADASGLKALRASIMELKKRNKDSQPELHPTGGEHDRMVEREHMKDFRGDHMKELEGDHMKEFDGDHMKEFEGDHMERLEGDQMKQFEGENTKSFEGERPARVMSAAEKVERHEMILNKLLKHMEILGTGILTLSGHQTSDKLESKDLPEGCSVDGVMIGIHYPQAGGSTDNFVGRKETDEVAQGDNDGEKIKESEDGNKHDALSDLEVALHGKLIKAKGDAEVVNKLAEDLLPLSMRMKELDNTIRSLQDNTAEKDEVQKMKNYVKQSLERAETAMLSGKGLPGFKCMSCAHRLEKLNPNRAEFVPTNCMRRQVLPMHAAERLYHKEEHESPRNISPTSENQNKGLSTNSKQLLSPCNDAQVTPPTPLGKTKQAKK